MKINVFYFKTLGVALSVACVAITDSAFAFVASDNAADAVYADGWQNGDNGGSGFLPWAISSNNNDVTTFAGVFIGDSTAGAGDINTSGKSFGLYANPGSAFVNADRAFSTVLTPGDVFSFRLALNFDNGNKGFNLYAGSQGEVFNFNVGSGGSVSSANAVLNPGPGLGYDYGGNDAVLNVTVSITSASAFSYSITRNSSSGNQGTLFSGTVSGLTQNVSGFRLYNSGTDNGAAQNNLYANSFAIVPEPASFSLLLLTLGIAIIRRKRL